MGVDPFSFGGQRYAAEPDVVPVRVDVSRTTGNGWALRLRFEVAIEGPCMRCLDPSSPRFEVDAREVEDLLAGHEAIAEAAVFGVEDDEFGQRLKAVVVVREGQALEADELKKFVKANLASYKVPRDVDFVDELPRTSTGKVLKRELRDA